MPFGTRANTESSPLLHSPSLLLNPLLDALQKEEEKLYELLLKEQKNSRALLLSSHRIAKKELFEIENMRRLHVIAEIIVTTKKGVFGKSTLPSSPAEGDSFIAIPTDSDTTDSQKLLTLFHLLDTSTIYLKKMVGWALLFGKTLSCFYRFLLIKLAIQFLFKMPGLKQWDDTDGVTFVADAFAAFFAASDMIQTLRAANSSVLKLCNHPNWNQGFRHFISNTRNGVHPLDLLLSGFVFMMVSAMKGKVGTDNVLERGAQFPHMEFLKNLWLLSYFNGFSSAICFLAFQWFKQGMWVKKTNDELKDCAEWKIYRAEHKVWDHGTQLVGVMMAFEGALVGALSACYVNHAFEFQPLNLILFFASLSATYFNLFYSYNPIYRMECLLDRHKPDRCDACDHTPDLSPLSPAQSRCANIQQFFGSANNAVSSFGSAMTFPPAITRGAQVVFHLITLGSGNARYENMSNSSYFVLINYILSMPSIFFSLLQGMAVWGKNKKPEFKSKPKALTLSSPRTETDLTDEHSIQRGTSVVIL